MDLRLRPLSDGRGSPSCAPWRATFEGERPWPKIPNPAPALLKDAHVDAARYDAMYAASISDPEAFWGEHGKRIDWIKPYTKVKDTSLCP